MSDLIHNQSVSGLVVLTGNPNCGKTTLFNELTGLNAQVGNYAGVTVEKKEGKFLGAPKGSAVIILDLPGTYSLTPHSLDEQISRDVLFQRMPDVAAPSLVVVVVDASNLHRNLYYATQVIELGYPTIVALNMVDVAKQNGHQIDVNKLERHLGVSVVPVIASQGTGLVALRESILKLLGRPQKIISRKLFCTLPAPMETEVDRITEKLVSLSHRHPVNPQAESLLVISDEKALQASHYDSEIVESIQDCRQRLTSQKISWNTAVIEARYAQIARISSDTITETAKIDETLSDRIDRIVTHKFWGLGLFVAIMALMFEAIFVFAQWPMNLLDNSLTLMGSWISKIIPPGDLHSLLIDGVIAGVGAVIVFLPQICLLFLFIGLLEDTGYMARAAFIMDRLMNKVGLHGKSFIPLLSSFACAIPGIMSTRTLDNEKDRLVTILIAPLIACSARLPIYTLLIAACIPSVHVWGFFHLPSLVLLGAYLMGVLMALVMGTIFKKTLLKSEPTFLVLELPPYKIPAFKQVLRHMWDRSKMFLQKAGTVILAINIIIWFISAYPKNDEIDQRYASQKEQLQAALSKEGTNSTAFTLKLDELDQQVAEEKLANSFAGKIGRVIEPLIAPLGMDWKIGVGIVTSFAAREVFVSTLATVYNVSNHDDLEHGLAETLKKQKRADGTQLYTPLMGLTIIVFYIFALQCISTIAIVKRETNSWKWPLFQWAYLTGMAWVMSFITYQGGRLLGY